MIEKISRNGISATCGENNFIEVTEWTNGMGYDITINDKQVSLSFEELERINTLVGLLNNGDMLDDE